MRPPLHRLRASTARLLGGLVPGLLAFLLAAPTAATERSALVDGNPDLTKVSSHLLELRRQALAGRSVAALVASNPLLRSRQGMPRIEVRLEMLDAALMDRLAAAGLRVTDASPRWARAYGHVDPRRLDELAAIPEVSTIHPDYGATTWSQGSVVGQGDASFDADDARAGFGLDGSGVRVGVLSDSFNRTRGGIHDTSAPDPCDHTVSGMTNQSTLDLPSPAGLVKDLTTGGLDEGAAMGEVLRDVAPGADLLFRTALVSETDFAAGIGELAACGVDLLVDDILYYAEPMFQDGPVAQAADAAVAAGIPYFSAAGNGGSYGVDDTFADSNPESDDTAGFPSGDDLHDFDESAGIDSFATLTLPHGCGLRAVLQWSEPYDGSLGPGATSDLDLYLFDSPVASVGTALTSSNTFTGCGQLSCDDPDNPSGAGCIGGDPFEIVAYTNTSGGPETVHLAVEHFCGSEEIQLRIATFGRSCSITTPTFDDAAVFDDLQLYGHAAAEGVLAIAAAYYDEIDTEKAGGTLHQTDVEPFSSLGGFVPFYFDHLGARLSPAGLQIPGAAPPAPAFRLKPDLTAPDGGNTTFFGTDLPEDPDTLKNFRGTSAAAPHAAAVAALLQEAAHGHLTPFAVSQILIQTAADIEVGDYSTGPDPLSGHGLIRADLAAGVVATTVPAVSCPSIAPPVLVLEGQVITGAPVEPVVLRACSELTVGAGAFGGVEGRSPTLIFTDGFESGEVSSWSNSVP